MAMMPTNPFANVVLSDAVRCEWCGAEPGEKCNTQDSYNLGGAQVHSIRVASKAAHEAWMASGRSSYGGWR